jgi:hypothetical protein
MTCLSKTEKWMVEMLNNQYFFLQEVITSCQTQRGK